MSVEIIWFFLLTEAFTKTIQHMRQEWTEVIFFLILQFAHNDASSCLPRLREATTSTGVMLSAPFNSRTASYPPRPPYKYKEKDAPDFKDTNLFSAHDNRNTLQDRGEYFGNVSLIPLPFKDLDTPYFRSRNAIKYGAWEHYQLRISVCISHFIQGQDTRLLGKGLSAPAIKQHKTEKDMLKHFGRFVCHYDYRTVYDTSYEGCQYTERPTKRRFPRCHQNSPQRLAKRTTTTEWFDRSEPAAATPMQVLANTQEPFLGHNSWKYSNHGRSKCYPPYEYDIHKGKPFSPWVVQGPKSAPELKS